MPTYVFKGRNRMNESVMGERVADNREALRQMTQRYIEHMHTNAPVHTWPEGP